MYGFTTMTDDTAHGIAAALPGDWTAERVHPHYVKMTRVDGLALGFDVWSSDERVEVSLIAPHEHVRYDEKRPSIRVSPDRGADVLARDIARRLLPDAEALHALVVERIQRAEAHAASVADNFTALGLEQDGADQQRARLRAGGVWGDATVYSDSVTLELHSLTVDQAAQILAMLRG